VLSIVLGAILVWRTVRQTPAATSEMLDPAALDARLLQTESALGALRHSQEAVNQRLTDTSARTSLLRDEVLGVTQRSALIEDSVRELAGARHDGETSLRVDEAELLLTFAQQRLLLADDLAGAIRATELAENVLAQQRDPALLNLRQALAQELAALRRAPPSPQIVAARELDAFEAALPTLAAAGPGIQIAPAPGASGLQRLLSAFVQVRSSGEQDLLAPEDRNTGEAALELEMAIARTALDRRNVAGFRASLARLDRWLVRLYAPGPALARERARLTALAKFALSSTLPEAGSTLEELHAWQRQRSGAP
jgi:uroporphyrin-3 C-methyltransferase